MEAPIQSKGKKINTTTEKSRAKRWTFTISNYTEEDEINVDNWSYLIMGKEICPSTGTPHIQGFGITHIQAYFHQVKKWIPRGHIEVARGSNAHNYKYCTKSDGDAIQWGTLPEENYIKGGQATQKLYTDTWDLAKEGRFEDIDPVLRIKHYHTLKRIKQDFQVRPEDNQDVCGEWYYGPPDTGKSKTAREKYPGYYDKPCNKWWDGYQMEENIIIDDFDLNHRVLGHHIKRWLDRYSFPAEMKGTTVQIRPKKIIITSNYRIAEIWPDDNILVEAITRRCNITSFKKLGM